MKMSERTVERYNEKGNVDPTGTLVFHDDYNDLLNEISDLYEKLAGAYILASGTPNHASDCATSNAPAMEPGPCDCGAVSVRAEVVTIEDDLQAKNAERYCWLMAGPQTPFKKMQIAVDAVFGPAQALTSQCVEQAIDIAMERDNGPEQPK